MGPGALSLHGTCAACTCAYIPHLCTGWPLCGHAVCADSVLVHTHVHTCVWGHAGTCGGTQTHTGSPLVVTSTHTQNRCASHLGTGVLCTHVYCAHWCVSPPVTRAYGVRDGVCVHPPHHGGCRASHSCAHVLCAGGRAVLGLGSAFRLLPVGSFSWSSQLLVSHRWCAF